LVVALAAFGTVCVAWKGLRTWQDELIGREAFDLARRVVRDAFEYYRAVMSLRNPFMGSAERGEDEDEQAENIYAPEASQYRGTVRGYTKRE
jgi:hypothetical protein